MWEGLRWGTMGMRDGGPQSYPGPHGNTADPFALLRRDQRHKCAPAPQHTHSPRPAQARTPTSGH
uniref:Uncharacterized protein n=1 Tax=Anguilla anguilla TaxID=7936 RepID=A0A0E9PB44_ANGAN